MKNIDGHGAGAAKRIVACIASLSHVYKCYDAATLTTFVSSPELERVSRCIFPSSDSFKPSRLLLAEPPRNSVTRLRMPQANTIMLPIISPSLGVARVTQCACLSRVGTTASSFGAYTA